MDPRNGPIDNVVRDNQGDVELCIPVDEHEFMVIAAISRAPRLVIVDGSAHPSLCCD